jgi:hypothetical protein
LRSNYPQSLPFLETADHLHWAMMGCTLGYLLEFVSQASLRVKGEACASLCSTRHDPPNDFSLIDAQVRSSQNTTFIAFPAVCDSNGSRRYRDIYGIPTLCVSSQSYPLRVKRLIIEVIEGRNRLDNLTKTSSSFVFMPAQPSNPGPQNGGCLPGSVACKRFGFHPARRRRFHA